MQLLAPQWLMPLHHTLDILEDHAVLVAEGRIAGLGPKTALQQQYPNATCTELPGQLMMPGLINGHSHAAMNLLRGAADDLPLHDWLQKRIWPLEGALADGNFVYDGTALACAEMLLNGITTSLSLIHI
jgi:5-methylthioadenosine/S-adenosylhomocysteine deaminase